MNLIIDFMLAACPIKRVKKQKQNNETKTASSFNSGNLGILFHKINSDVKIAQ